MCVCESVCLCVRVRIALYSMCTLLSKCLDLVQTGISFSRTTLSSLSWIIKYPPLQRRDASARAGTHFPRFSRLPV